MTDAVLIADNIGKTFHVEKKPVPVLSGVSLAVNAAESVAVTGASGSGKSTLLHILGTLLTPDTGTVAFRGRVLTGASRSVLNELRANQFGFVFQSYHLMPDLTVLENVLFGWHASTRPALSLPDATARARTLLDRVGLSARLDHLPRELSGGEQQRVAIARALIQRPAVLLADEPTGNLDRNTGESIMSLLFELSSESGASLVVVTHDERIAGLCHRRLRLDGGKIVG